MIKNKIIYIVTIALAIIYIFLGNKVVTRKSNKISSMDTEYKKAKVISILNIEETIAQAGSSEKDKDITVTFEAKITSKKHKGEIVKSEQKILYPNAENAVKIKEGDKILVVDAYQDEDGNTEWKYIDRERITPVIFLGIIFILLLTIFGKKKGINTILALCFIVLSIFTVFIPSILAGFNVYFMAIITCIFIVLTTSIIVYGINDKSVATVLGCFGGMIISLVLLLSMDSILHLTGYTSEEAMFLILLDLDNPINLKAIVFASIIIGAIGAIMDISIDIASSLKEIASKIDKPTFKEIFKSGITIGRDIIATMTNTLVLAYIGSSLLSVVLIVSYDTSLINLFNKEAIIIEILQALVGSLGLLFTIPFTSIVCGIVYSHRGIAEELKYIRETIRNKVMKRGSITNE